MSTAHASAPDSRAISDDGLPDTTLQ